MQKTILFLVFGIYLELPASGNLIVAWDFNDLNVLSGISGEIDPVAIEATYGSGRISLSGWGGNIGRFTGTTVNRLPGGVAGGALALIAGGGSGGLFPSNGSFLTMTTSLRGFANAEISYATQRSSTGFNHGLWEWSVDGKQFRSIESVSPIGTFERIRIDLSPISEIEGADHVFFRYTLSGATSASGNNRIDNLMIQGSIAAVPEPNSLVLVLMLLTVLLARRSLARVRSLGQKVSSRNLERKKPSGVGNGDGVGSMVQTVVTPKAKGCSPWLSKTVSSSEVDLLAGRRPFMPREQVSNH